MRAPVSLTTGQQLPSRRIGPITQTDIVRFAGAGGDFNPLHHDPEYARRAGLPGVIAMGQMQAGMLAGYLSDQVHVEHLLSYAVRFAGTLAVGETLDLQGTVTAVDAEAGTAEVELTATAGERTVIAGSATVRVA
ncbi:acyl dehydratase [Gordonia paraffinivorans]|uniref:MaoC/PaaZ C-terminal domain-containing protein n=1 Tax=Gordonia paraffinivorans TaxID=175628 RepID=UPI001C92E71F|nr:MaoC/PaaZ C-terminal domain-containing protein [Gordonia paraffinivorans]MBY4573365.1 acyl dehydratase [Gordonia paraffinivorans]